MGYVSRRYAGLDFMLVGGPSKCTDVTSTYLDLERSGVDTAVPAGRSH